ncbi:PH domain-containing protein [Nocardia stercoris]|uniref:PH domain-containing protein n=1 Tax=Nocardia stercoris TaxID=2483361 RepID=UPI001F448D4F|nr:PH domain-containing protein [Nocardia stercoris]
MATEQTTGDWDLVVRPRRATLRIRIVAALIAVAFLVAGLLSSHQTTGVNFRVADQGAVVLLGLLIAGGVLVLARPRVRVGARGVEVRNLAGTDLFAWPDIRGVSFPEQKRWARLELVGDEYAPLMAIRANDGEYAAQAMATFRKLGAHYTGTE